ncbi:hypothetical protein [Candidatus Uabimicrobium sp. HlEnr_7]|uniref:hypothetical protein n=1 Tax=Candidatus Uabimicrobium helgolandensis TaxID=3095367 RepID=UPI00355845DE
MKKILFFIVILGVLAADYSTKQLKQKHEQMIHFFGDSLLLEGTHSFLMQTNKKAQKYSVYRKGNVLSRFWKESDWELYHSVSVMVENNSTTVQNTYKLTQNFQTQTLQYYTFFEKQKNAIVSKVVIDHNASTFEKKHYDTILKCTTRQGLALVPKIMECPATNKINCILDVVQGQASDQVVSCILKTNSTAQTSGVYWRIFLKPQGMGFMSAKPFGAKDECTTKTGCVQFVIPSGYKITIKAAAAPGHKFEYWQYKGNLLSLDAEYSFVPSAGGDLVAHFNKE